MDTSSLVGAAIRRDGIPLSALRFTPLVPVRECRDAKDDKYLELALAAGASTIISSDNDLLVLSPWRRVQILRPGDYLAVRQNTPSL